MNSQQHSTTIDRSDVVGQTWRENEHVAFSEIVVDVLRHHIQAAFQGVDRDEARRGVFLEVTARIEREQHLGDRSPMEERDLPVAAASRMVLGPELSEGTGQREAVTSSREALSGCFSQSYCILHSLGRAIVQEAS
jgi:hypothetical protein